MATEKRLISVDEWDSFFAEHIYNRCFRNEYEQGYTDALDRVDAWMDEHPTVDAVEVVHGRWRWGRNSMNQYGAWCSECECGWEDKGNDFDRVQGLVIAHKYCPHCGAKMDGDTSEL